MSDAKACERFNVISLFPLLSLLFFFVLVHLGHVKRKLFCIFHTFKCIFMYREVMFFLCFFFSIFVHSYVILMF